jgi:hypothetical protein
MNLQKEIPHVSSRLDIENIYLRFHVNNKRVMSLVFSSII